MQHFNDIPAAIARLADEEVEIFLFAALEFHCSFEQINAPYHDFCEVVPRGFRVLCSIDKIVGGATNGTMGQFYWNRVDWDHDAICADAISGFEQIGALAQAESLKLCLEFFERLKPQFPSQAARESKKKRTLFQQWLALWEQNRPAEIESPLWDEAICRKLMVAWIRRNPELFGFP